MVEATPVLTRPVRAVSGAEAGTEEFLLALAARMASRFKVPRPVEVFEFAEKGNINHHTYLVTAGRERDGQQYLLQRINRAVFTQPVRVMRAMIASIEAQRASLARTSLPDDLDWQVITLLPTNDNAEFLEFTDRRGAEVWRLMVRIPDCRTYKSLAELPTDAERLAVAEETGRGLAIYGELTAGMDPGEIVNPLPGYRDTGNYYHQLHSVLNGATTSEEAAQWLPSDETLLHSTGTHFLLHLPRRDFQKRRDDPALQPFIRMALEHQEFALTLQRKLRRGEIRTLAIHGDTKLDNFLFCNRTGRVKALIDLDTIMPHTWLADWGDMVRSLANVAGEREQNLEKVQVDQAIFLALAKGFLAVARKITQAERELMVDAVRIIALELGVRFLADYLRGDSYFRLGPADTPELNRIRAMAQLTLFQRLTEQRAALSGALQEVDKQSAE